MTDATRDDFERRLRELGDRIDQKMEETRAQGPAHGADRERAADWKLEHVRISEAARSGQKKAGELSADLKTLELTFERWLARIDKQARA